MSDPWTDAWAEAVASCPTSTTVYETVELQHPPSRSRIACRPALRAGQRGSRARHRGGRGLQSGEHADLHAYQLLAAQPEFAQGKVPECKITIDNVGRQLMPYLNAAVRVRADLVLVYRQYRSDDVTEACYGPVSFVVRNVRITGARVEGTAKLADLANAKFPTRAYTTAEFPALRA